jgi:hypothetical protein
MLPSIFWPLSLSIYLTSRWFWRTMRTSNVHLNTNEAEFKYMYQVKSLTIWFLRFFVISQNFRSVFKGDAIPNCERSKLKWTQWHETIVFKTMTRVMIGQICINREVSTLLNYMYMYLYLEIWYMYWNSCSLNPSGPVVHERFPRTLLNFGFVVLWTCCSRAVSASFIEFWVRCPLWTNCSRAVSANFIKFWFRCIVLFGLVIFKGGFREL